jgi:hypothetical protein
MLSSDSIVEKSMTMAFLLPDKNTIRGTVTSNPGYFESLYQRGYIKEKGQPAFFDKIKSSYGSDFEISNPAVDSLKSVEDPLKITYDLSFKQGEEDIIYLNPVLVPFFKDNPFSAAVRRYPVEMPYKIDETFILNLKLPEGYVVDEIPKSTKVKLNEDEGMFEYLISAKDGIVQLRTRLNLAKANFPAEDYESLREFFSYVVKKQSEQIVLKKKLN